MARYYFDLRDGTQLFRDEEGSELPNDDAARDEATAALGGIVKDALPGKARLDMVLDVRDANRALFTARLRFEIAAVPGNEDASNVAANLLNTR